MANQIRHANGPLPQAANTTLTASIGASGSSSPTVASAANLPTLGPFLIVVDNERIEVDSISGTTLTILSGGRGKEGTSAASHSSGANVYQVLSAGNLARAIEDRTGTVLAPDPTGTAATDKSNLDALTSTANQTVQLRPGTYVFNPLAAFAAGVVLRGAPNRATTLKLAVQATPQGITLGTGGRLEGIVLDGDRANQTFASNGYEFLVELASGARVRDCKFQNIKSSAVGAKTNPLMLEIPTITSLTTSTSGGSLATGVLHWYRVTATTASGETQASAEASVTTGAGSTNSNTLRWRAVAGASGYKVYHATTAGGQWNELLLTTIGSGSTLVFVHTTGSGATTAPPMNNTTAGTTYESPEVTDNEFTAVTRHGMYLQNNVNRGVFSRNRFSLIQENCIKLNGAANPGDFSMSIDNLIEDNVCDYSGVTVAGNFAIAIELWNGVHHTIISGNHVIGPADNSTADLFIGISLGGNADNTSVVANTVRKSNPNGSDKLIAHGIENNGNSGVVIEGNTIFGCNYGISVGRVDYSAGGVDNCSVVGNRVIRCGDFGIQITEGSGHTVQGNTFIDAGWRYIFLNGFEKPTLSNAVVGNTCFIASNDRSGANSGRLDAIYVVDSGRCTITGNICGPLPSINTPGTPTVTAQGTTGATSYSYKVTAVNEYGETVGSATGTVANGNATLTGGNFNRITWTRINSASGYRIYRTASAGTPSSLGYIGFTAEAYGATPTFDDTGIAADTNITAPATGTTSGTSTVGLTGLYFQGTTLIESSVISANRWDGAAPVGAAQPDYAVVFDNVVDYTQVVNNFAQNYDVGFLTQINTPGSNPNYVQFNLAPGVPLPHVVGAKFKDVVRRSEEVQRAGGGMYLVDDFTGGLITTGNIGALGWQFTAAVGTGVIAGQAGVASHPGIVRMNTSATTNSRFYLWLGSGTGATTGQILPADWFSMVVMFRMNQTPDTATLFRVGLGNSATADPPTDGVYIEKLLTDSTQLFGLNRASSTSSTRTSALATISNGAWMKAVIRRVSASAIGFSVSTSFAPDNGTESTVSTNVPTTALVPFLLIGNNTTVDKTADVDYFELNVNNMNR